MVVPGSLHVSIQVRIPQADRPDLGESAIDVLHVRISQPALQNSMTLVRSAVLNLAAAAVDERRQVAREQVDVPRP